MTGDVVFIHGMFMNARSWEGWLPLFSARGFRCHTLAWPSHDGTPSALRKSAPPELGKLTLGGILDTVRAFLKRLDSKPILVGHSMGGLVTQKMINEGLAEAGVCLDSAPPKGIFVPKWSLLKVNLPVINPFAGDKPFLFTLEQFHYAFCNTMTLEQAREAFEKYVVPESRNVPRSAAGNDGAIDFIRPHAPLLFVAGEMDHTVPWQINQKNFAAYRDPQSKREFKLLPGRSHFLCGQPGWEGLAELVLTWLDRA